MNEREIAYSRDENEGCGHCPMCGEESRDGVYACQSCHTLAEQRGFAFRGYSTVGIRDALYYLGVRLRAEGKMSALAKPEKRYGVRYRSYDCAGLWCNLAKANASCFHTVDRGRADGFALEIRQRNPSCTYDVCEFVEDATKAVPVEATPPPEEWGFIELSSSRRRWVGGFKSFAEADAARYRVMGCADMRFGSAQQRPTGLHEDYPRLTVNEILATHKGSIKARGSAKVCHSCRAPLGEHPLTDDSGRVYCERAACWPEDHKRAARSLSDALHGLSCDSRSMEPYGPKPSYRGFPFIPPDVGHLAFSIFAHELRPEAALRAEAALTDESRVDAVLAKMWERAEFAEKRKDCEARAEAYVVEMGRRASGGAQ